MKSFCDQDQHFQDLPEQVLQKIRKQPSRRSSRRSFGIPSRRNSRKKSQLIQQPLKSSRQSYSSEGFESARSHQSDSVV